MNQTDPKLARIRIYPIKSLDPVDLTEASIGYHSLQHDREFALIAEDGNFVNGKRTGRVCELRTEFDLRDRNVTFSLRSRDGDRAQFSLDHEPVKIEKYLSEFFDMRVNLVSSVRGELMDIPGTASATILSSASLQSLGENMGYSIEDLRLRFRANLELNNVPAYWEERLFGEPGTGIHFKVGEVNMIGISPRARCNVPPRHPLTGITDKSFIKAMIAARTKTLPNASLLPKHGNMYHLTVNTFIPDSEQGRTLRVGDGLKIVGFVKLNQ